MLLLAQFIDDGQSIRGFRAEPRAFCAIPGCPPARRSSTPLRGGRLRADQARWHMTPHSCRWLRRHPGVRQPSAASCGGVRVPARHRGGEHGSVIVCKEVEQMAGSSIQSSPLSTAFAVDSSTCWLVCGLAEGWPAHSPVGGQPSSARWCSAWSHVRGCRRPAALPTSRP